MRNADVLLEHSLESGDLRPGPDPPRSQRVDNFIDFGLLDERAAEDQEIVTHVVCLSMSELMPTDRWVLHAAPLLGGVTDRWIDLQARLTDRYDSRLLGGTVQSGVSREKHWIVAEDRWSANVAWRLLEKSRGASGPLLASLLPEQKPAVLHGHYGTLAAQLRQFSRRLDAPLVASFYGYDATKTEIREHARWQRQYRDMFREVAAVVVEGPAMAARVEAIGCPSDKLRVVRLPADAEGLAECRRVKADRFTAVAAGRFIEKKGFDTAISGFARALRGEDAQLLMIGGGELDDELRAHAVREGVDDQVVWAGRLPFQEFMATISAAHIGLYPSRTASSGDSEGGAPVTLIEAQWLGVPSIVSDHDDLPFVSAPDGTIVLPPGDVEAWAEAIDHVYHRPDELKLMGDEVEAFVKRHHAPETNLREREQLYDAITS